MNIRINEIAAFIEDGLTLGAVAKLHKTGADVLILNGFPAAVETLLHEGDELFLYHKEYLKYINLFVENIYQKLNNYN